MIVAGIHLRRQDVLELASLLNRNGADVAARNLTTAITTGKNDVTLTDDDRESIIAVLRDPPPASRSSTPRFSTTTATRPRPS